MFKSVRVYGIRHKKTKEVWVAASDKFMWLRKQDCKGAFWSTEGYYFRNQNEWEIVEFRLVEIDKEEEKINEFYRKKVGLK